MQLCAQFYSMGLMSGVLIQPIIQYSSSVFNVGSYTFLAFCLKCFVWLKNTLDENHLGLTSLAKRRLTTDLKFLAALLNNNNYSSVLISLICFKIPPRSSRFTAPFYVPYATTTYMVKEPLRRLITFDNADSAFNDSLYI